jgi:hypothetical protein
MSGLAGRLSRLELLGTGTGTLYQDARRVLQFLAEESPDRPLPTLEAIMDAFRAQRCITHGEWLVIWSTVGIVFRQYVDVDLAAV